MVKNAKVSLRRALFVCQLQTQSFLKLFYLKWPKYLHIGSGFLDSLQQDFAIYGFIDQ